MSNLKLLAVLAMFLLVGCDRFKDAATSKPDETGTYWIGVLYSAEAGQAMKRATQAFKSRSECAAESEKAMKLAPQFGFVNPQYLCFDSKVKIDG